VLDFWWAVLGSNQWPLPCEGRLELGPNRDPELSKIWDPDEIGAKSFTN